jgi:protein gp37
MILSKYERCLTTSFLSSPITAILWSHYGWKNQSRRLGYRQRAFCASMADVFDNQVPEEWRQDLLELIRDCKRLDWLLLTKRPQNILKMLPVDWGDGYRNVWLGLTGENQEWFDRRWSILQRIPAAVPFISYEPAIGPLRLPRHGPLPDWLISGGEKRRAKKPRFFVKKRRFFATLKGCI